MLQNLEIDAGKSSTRQDVAGDGSRGRVLFAIGSLDLGGAESQLALLAKQLVRRGWSVEIFTLEKKGPLVVELAERINVIDGGYRFSGRTRPGRLLSLGMCELRLILHLCRYRPDVLHAYLPLTNFLGALAARLAAVPVVVTSKRGLGKHQDRHPKLKWMDRAANALSHVVTANSHAVANDSAERDDYPAARIEVVRNGLDFTRFEAGRSNRNVTREMLRLGEADIAIVKVANLIPYKGHAELVAAFAGIAANDSRLRLFLIGDDRDLGTKLLDAARSAGIEGRISLLGARRDVPELLSAMDLGVMASHEEGSSNALLEKLAAGLPVVATDVGGNPETLEDMPDCLLVRPNDADDLARGLQRAVGQLPASRTRSDERRRLIHQRFSVDAMVEAYERIYSTRMRGGND